MIKVLSYVSAKTYKIIIKPVLFKQQPDHVHERLLRSGVKLQKVRLVRGLVKLVWAYDNQAVLGQEVLGVSFKNPIGLSAGFDKNFELPFMIKAVGFGFMEGGSLTDQPCEGNQRPWYYRLPKTKSLVVHAGLANQGAAQILNRINSYTPTAFADFPLNISVAKTNSQQAASEADAVADYVAALAKVKHASVGSMVTINISCPNAYGGEPFTTPKRLDHLLREVDVLNLEQPVFIKMPIDLPWARFNELLIIASKHKVAGVTIGNLAKDRAKANIVDPLPATIKGGLSGRPTWELSNDLIRRTYVKHGKRFVIIGVGGVFSAEDAYTKIKLGATLVELITGMIFEGPQLIGQINCGLTKLLKQDGYTNVIEAVGVDARSKIN